MSLTSRLKNKQIVEEIEFVLHESLMFAVSKCGKVLGRSGRVLKQQSNGCYRTVSYQSSDGVVRHKYVHRLVAETFISNPENLPYVNHLDGDKSNNSVYNLQWCTPKQNSKHAIETGLAWNLPRQGECGFRSKLDD